MRIAFSCPRSKFLKSGLSGDRVLVQNILDGLSNYGAKIEIATDINVYDFWRGQIGADKLWQEARSIRRRMQAFRPDAWLVYGATTTYPDLYGWWQQSLQRYVHLHPSVDPATRLKAPWDVRFDAIHNRSLAVADAVVAARHKTMKMLVKAGVPQRKLHLLVPPCEIWGDLAEQQAARRELGLPDSAPIFLCIGRFAPSRSDGHPWKTEWLMSLLDIVSKSDLPEDAIFLLAGDGDGRAKIEAQIKALNLENRVRLLGYVSRAKIQALYVASDCFTFVATSDRVWVASMEAQACGTPLLTIRTPTMDLIVEHGKTGLLAENEGEMSRLMAELARNRDKCRLLGAAARERIQSQFSIQSLVRELAKLLDPDP